LNLHVLILYCSFFHPNKVDFSDIFLSHGLLPHTVFRALRLLLPISSQTRRFLQVLCARFFFGEGHPLPPLPCPDQLDVIPFSTPPTLPTLPPLHCGPRALLGFCHRCIEGNFSLGRSFRPFQRRAFPLSSTESLF